MVFKIFVISAVRSSWHPVKSRCSMPSVSVCTPKQASLLLCCEQSGCGERHVLCAASYTEA